MTRTTTAAFSDRIQYPAATVARADLALRCSPFRLHLFDRMRQHSVPLPQIAGPGGVEHGYTLKALPELAIESHLMWLIRVGLLRREVDGQGITDSFRLTLLGRQVIAAYEADGTWPAPNWRDRLRHLATRWLRQ